MNLYTFFVTTYNSFISIFPPPLQWLVTLLILIGILAVIASLLHHRILLLLIVIVLLPFIIPVVVSFVSGIWQFIVHLLAALHIITPSPS